jgi:hypothetical protein
VATMAAGDDPADGVRNVVLVGPGSDDELIY